jgi:hypothetical protein
MSPVDALVACIHTDVNPRETAAARAHQQLRAMPSDVAPHSKPSFAVLCSHSAT